MNVDSSSHQDDLWSSAFARSPARTRPRPAGDPGRAGTRGPRLGTIRKGTTCEEPIRRALFVGGVLSAALGLTAGSAYATEGAGDIAAYFVLNQPDWSCSNEVYASMTAYLEFQCDGNVVLYNRDTGSAMWATGTAGKGVTDLDWSQSGYLKLEKSNGTVVCTVGATDPAPGGVVIVQDDGNLVFYNTSGNATWSSKTSGEKQGTKDHCSPSTPSS